MNCKSIERFIDPKDSEIGRIVIWYDSIDSQMLGFQLYSTTDQMVLETGYSVKGQR